MTRRAEEIREGRVDLDRLAVQVERGAGVYAYLLENGMDVVNSDMQNLKHLEENAVAARDAHTYFA